MAVDQRLPQFTGYETIERKQTNLPRARTCFQMLMHAQRSVHTVLYGEMAV